MRLEDLAQGLPPTDRLYLRDSYLTRFSTRLLRAKREGKNKIYLIMEATSFHPKSGGQPSDTGFLRGTGYVVKVLKAMGFRDTVVHLGSAEGKVSETVTGEIDWAPRYVYMRRHTAGHLLDHCLTVVSGSPVETTGSWLGEGCYVGYRGTAPPLQKIMEAVDLENELIPRGGGVTVEEVNRDELHRRAPNAPNIARLPSLESYRVVTIQGSEPLPCGGTHLRDIREVGHVKLGGVEQHEGEFRIYYDVETTP